MKYELNTVVPAILACLLSGIVSATPITGDGDASLAGASVWDFDELALTGLNQTASIVNPGGDVTFSALGSQYAIQDYTTYGYSDGPGIRTQGPTRVYEFVFGSSVSAFGMDLGAINSVWTATAFDSANGFIESVAWPGACCGQIFRGIASTGIARVRISGSDDLLIDNLRYATAAKVPEPGPLALLGIGLVGMGFAGRRKKV